MHAFIFLIATRPTGVRPADTRSASSQASAQQSTLMRRSWTRAPRRRLPHEAGNNLIGAHSRWMLGALCAGLGLLFWPVGLRAADYHLGFGDKVRVSVHEWRADRGDFFEWSPLKGKFTVGPTGTLSLPVIGDVPANGATPKELADRIASALQEQAGLARLPVASVEIAEFRPFYIVGGVEKPGQYPFRPGMTVIEAISVAQGLYRTRESGLLRIERDNITARGDLRLFGMQLAALTVHLARLQAELDQKDTFQFPKDPPAGIDPRAIGWDAMKREEQLAFDTRRESLKRQLDTGSQLIASLEQEVQSLRERAQLRKRQADAVDRELGRIRNLLDRGLTNTARQLDLDRLLSEYQSNEIELGTAVVRAQQEIAKARLAMAQLQDQRQADVVQDLQKTQIKINEYKEKLKTTQGLVSESELSAAKLDAMTGPREPVEPVLSIIRQGSDGESHEMPVAQITAIEPGDLVKVELPLPGQPRFGPSSFKSVNKTVANSPP
jgi:protein involved in polysaccharide export with SLBB domain